MRVFNSNNLPIKAPVSVTISSLVALNFFNPAEWIWYLVGFLLSALWLNFILVKVTEREVDFFDNFIEEETNQNDSIE